MFNPAMMPMFADNTTEGPQSSMDYMTGLIANYMNAQAAQQPQYSPAMMQAMMRQYQSQEPMEQEQAPTSAYGRIAEQGQIPVKGGKDLMSLLKQRESGGRYGIENTLGYSGAYQFGAGALETVGLLKKGAGKKGNKALNDASNWTLPGGKKEFLSNPAIQDAAMQRLMASNKATLQKMGVINKYTTPQQVNALLAASHLAGPGGAAKAHKGYGRKDAYGTSSLDYYKMGLGAV
jgi:hypothetical protein